ncbi:hypothetical protein AeRB84_012381, partial [Aphanomyces euteiches]
MPTEPARLSSRCSTGRKAERNLRHDERLAVYETLLACSSAGALPHGIFVTLASKLSLRKGSPTADIGARIKENSGRKKKRTAQQIKEAVKSVQLESRQTLRAMSEQCQAKSNYSKPFLTEDNKIIRIQHALSFLRPSSRSNHIFSSMHNLVHVDEKWFYVTKVKKKFYVFPEEVLPKRSAKSKHFITKVMFLDAVCRPRYDYHNECMFDSKLGVWPFVEKVVAKRGSKNRPRGTVETVPQSVTSDVYKDMVLSKDIPAIQAKYPRGGQLNTIYLQQDNASPHRRVTTKWLVENGI